MGRPSPSATVQPIQQAMPPRNLKVRASNSPMETKLARYLNEMAGIFVVLPTLLCGVSKSVDQRRIDNTFTCFDNVVHQ